MAALPYPDTPLVDRNLAVACLAMNIFAPGIGTIAAGILGEKPMLRRGIAQLLLMFVLVGWIWALVTGVQLLQNAVAHERAARGPPPAPPVA